MTWKYLPPQLQPTLPGTFPPGPSSAIGEFVIGISPIGELVPFNPWVTIISQYANSPIIDGMITSFNKAMDQTDNMLNFYDMIWNIQTATGYGLDVWGRIVGVSRALSIPGGVTYFGFKEADGLLTGFGQGGFYTGGGVTNNFLLSDDDFRVLILAKAAGNISDGSIESVNAILMALFPNRGNAYVVDGLDMSLTYTFTFGLTTVELAILGQSNVLPNPAGVVVNIAII